MSSPVRPYKYLVFFVAAFITCYLTQEVLLNRLVMIGAGYITGGTFIYFASPLITDVVAEVYGYRVARQMLWCGLFSLLFLAASVALCLSAPYPPFWGNVANAYFIALHSISRAVIVGTISIFVGQTINAYLISRWKVLMRGRYFWLRSFGSSVIGDAVTVTISIIGIFAGKIPITAFRSTLAPELIIMVLFSAMGAVPASILATVVSRAEGLNTYDIGIDFNPFSLGTKN